MLWSCSADPPAEGPDASNPADARAGDGGEPDLDAGPGDGGGGDGSAGPDGGPPDSGLEGPGLAGTLLDEEGAPIATMVLACQLTTCSFGASNRQGHFYFPIDPPANIALKTLPDLRSSPRKAATLAPVTISGSALVEVGAVYVPALPAGTPIGAASMDPQTLAAGDGLEVTLRRADLRAHIGDTLVDLAARLIPPERAPVIHELGAEQVVAIYALHPFAATSRSPIGFRAPSTLPAGTPVRFRALSELDGRLSEPAVGLADGAYVATSPGAGLTELTWLVISH